MLRIINLLKKNKIIKIFNKRGETINVHKRDIPLSKEWYNSSYNFNKNTIRFLPAVHEFLFKLLKRYFNMFNENMEINNLSRKYKKIKPTLINKVWISNPEIKHLNKKAIITIYVYNRLYNQYKKQLSLLKLTWSSIVKENKRRYANYINKTERKIKKVVFTRKMETFRQKNPIFLGTNLKIYHISRTFYVKMINWLKLNKYIKMEQYKSDIIKLMNKDKINLLKGLNLLNVRRHNYLINLFKKELIYIKLKQKMLFNKFKFSEIYLDPLIEFLQTVYKKKIELNIVILKDHYYSSSILSQIVTAKIRNKKNRGKALKPIIDFMERISVPILSSRKLPRTDKISVGMQNVILSKLENENGNDLLNKFLLTNRKSKSWSSKYIDNLALKNLENKCVSGVFIKATGRLTKRFKAQRAINLIKYKGTLKNVYSSHRGYSSALSRGYGNINVDKTMIHSKVRTGAFGLTGWVASY